MAPHTVVGRGRAGVMPSEVIPLRPMTLSELLDAALELLRRNALGLLPVAAGLAVAEQAVLYPGRASAQAGPPFYFPGGGHLTAYWLLLSTGLAPEPAS